MILCRLSREWMKMVALEKMKRGEKKFFIRKLPTKECFLPIYTED